jgi:hypothetical protein
MRSSPLARLRDKVAIETKLTEIRYANGQCGKLQS